MSWGELRAEVARAGAALREAGVGAGDRVGRHPAQHAREHRRRARRRFDRRGLVVLLARLRRAGRARPLRPDRAQGADRLRRLLLQRQDHRHRRQARSRSSPSCRRCAAVIVVPYLGTRRRGGAGPQRQPDPHGRTRADLARRRRARAPAEPLRFERLPFAHPLYMLFSSGTTGMPKCIVHSAGGTLLKHLCEHQLHADVKPGDRLFYFTTLGWMMWNWLVSGAGAGRDAAALRRLAVPSRRQRPVGLCAGRDGCTYFGTSAKYIDALKKAELHAGQHARPLEHARHAVDRLAAGARELRLRLRRRSRRTCTSPPSRAAPTSAAASCSASRPSPSGAARSRGRRSAWPSTSSTRPASRVTRGKGELVCTKPFPSMPVGFWNDPDGKKYHAAYFERFAEHLAPRRLRRVDRARRHDHPRPLRRHAQSRRRAHRHGRDLPPGRAAARGAGERSSSARTGTTTCASCCSWS